MSSRASVEVNKQARPYVNDNVRETVNMLGTVADTLHSLIDQGMNDSCTGVYLSPH